MVCNLESPQSIWRQYFYSGLKLIIKPNCRGVECFYVWVCVEDRTDFRGDIANSLPPSLSPIHHCHFSLLINAIVLIVLFLTSFSAAFYHPFSHNTWFWFCSFFSHSVMSSLLREEMQRVLFRPGKQRLVEFIEIEEPSQGRHFLCVAGK